MSSNGHQSHAVPATTLASPLRTARPISALSASRTNGSFEESGVVASLDGLERCPGLRRCGASLVEQMGDDLVAIGDDPNATLAGGEECRDHLGGAVRLAGARRTLNRQNRPVEREREADRTATLRLRCPRESGRAIPRRHLLQERESGAKGAVGNEAVRDDVLAQSEQSFSLGRSIKRAPGDEGRWMGSLGLDASPDVERGRVVVDTGDRARLPGSADPPP